MDTAFLVCAQCGHRNRLNARFCGLCGTALGTALSLKRTLAPPSADPAASSAPLEPGMLLGVGGRYEIRALLGRGGFGEAYLAEDTALGRPCVVKRLALNATWHASLARQISASFAREAELLVELNYPGHPNIPEIYEYLPESRCLVMKYVTGASLQQLLRQRAAPMPEDEALRYVRDACAALVYLHGHRPEPVLHRDLKPDNLMLDAIARVWMIDFGLARALPKASPSAETAHSQIAGTPGYTPPEQWAGAPEPRSDVYALAATLYALLSGQRPPQPSPPPVRQLNPEVRPEVEQTLEQAMQVSAGARPSAAELLRRLDELLASINIPVPPPPASPPPVSAVGREAELRALAAHLEAGGFVALTGMPGVGKSTIAALLATRAAAGGPSVFWHTCRAGEGAGVLISALAGWLSHQGQPEIWQLLQRAQQGGGVPPTPEQLADYLAQALAGRGYLLCFDDLHAAEHDQAVSSLLGRLYEATRGGPLRLVVTARTPPSFAVGAQISPLAGLSRQDSRELVRAHGLGLDDDRIADLHAATGGSPQLMLLSFDTLRAAADPAEAIGRLTRAGDLRRYLLQQVDGALSRAERQAMIAVAALLGQGATRDLLEAMLDGADLWATLEDLAARSLLAVAEDAGEARYHQHAVLRDFYYERPTRRERQALHLRAARFLADEYGDALAAARQYGRAGQPDEAARLLSERPWELFRAGQAQAVYDELRRLDLARLAPALRASASMACGEAAAMLGDYGAAAQLLEQALELWAEYDQPLRRARGHRLLSQVCERRGDYARAESLCLQGLALATAPGAAQTETARLYAQLGEVLLRREAFAEAEAACRAGLELLPPGSSYPAERAALLQRLASVAIERGDPQSAIDPLIQSLGLSRQAGDTLLTTKVLHNLGACYAATRRYAWARDHYEQSLRLTERLGYLAGRAETLNGLGLIHLANGEGEEALRCFEECRQLCERHELPGPYGSALLNIGQLRFERGDLVEARSSLEACERHGKRLGYSYWRAQSLYLLGDVALAQGQAAAAHDYASQALGPALQLGRPDLESAARRVIGESLLALGQIEAAAEALARAWALHEPMGDPYDRAWLLAARARLALAQDDRAAAGAHARESLGLAREQMVPVVQMAMSDLLERIER